MIPICSNELFPYSWDFSLFIYLFHLFVFCSVFGFVNWFSIVQMSFPLVHEFFPCLYTHCTWCAIYLALNWLSIVEMTFPLVHTRFFLVHMLISHAMTSGLFSSIKRGIDSQINRPLLLQYHQSQDNLDSPRPISTQRGKKINFLHYI